MSNCTVAKVTGNVLRRGYEMARKVAVVFVHGIQTDNASFAETMRRGLVRRLPKNLRDAVHFEPVFWGDAARGFQRNYLDRAANKSKLRATKLRHLLVEGLGDAAAYQKTAQRKNSTYHAIQDCVTQTLAKLDTPGHDRRPLIFIGHSLGCQIISSYAWDLNWLKQRVTADIPEEDRELREIRELLETASPFRRLETFAGFVTMGCNIPLFTFTFGPERVYPITTVKPLSKARGITPAFPGSALHPAVLNHSRWLNFYSKADLLGFPIKPLNDAYNDEDRIQDIVVRTEGPLSKISEATAFLSAHQGYWKNETVLTETAELIRAIAEA